MSAAPETKTAQELWQTYLFLTREMNRFLDKQDLDIFFDLLDQREKLQQMIDEAADEAFKLSDAGRAMLTVIRQENQPIILKLNSLLNAARRQRTMSQAYEGASSLGELMDRKR